MYHTWCFCRVYKNYDPRAKIIKDVAEDVFKITGRNPLIDIAQELEKIARSDDYFVSRKLYPNVDFYSGQSHHCNMHHCVFNNITVMNKVCVRHRHFRAIRKGLLVHPSLVTFKPAVC